MAIDAASHAALSTPQMVQGATDRLRCWSTNPTETAACVRSNIAWRYDLIRPEGALRRAAGSGRWTVPSRGGPLRSPDTDSRDGLELLLARNRHSLVAVEGGTRYRLLAPSGVRGGGARARGDETAQPSSVTPEVPDILAEAAPAGREHGIEGCGVKLPHGVDAGLRARWSVLHLEREELVRGCWPSVVAGPREGSSRGLPMVSDRDGRRPGRQHAAGGAVARSATTL